MVDFTVRIISGGWWWVGAANTLAVVQQKFDQVFAPSTVLVQFRVANGKLGAPDGLESLMTSADLADVDLIVTFDTRAHQFIDHLDHPDAPQVPIVALATSGARGGRPRPLRMTGVLESDPRVLFNRQLQLLHDVAPEVDHITILRYANARKQDAANQDQAAAVEILTQVRGFQLRGEILMTQVADAGNADDAITELDDGFNALFPSAGSEINPADPHEGLVVWPSAMVSYYRRSIIRNANDRSLRAVYPFTQFAREGGLLSYGVPRDLRFDRMVELARQVLVEQKHPSEVPLVDLLDTFQRSGNTTTAGEQNVVLDPHVLPENQWPRTADVNTLLAQSRAQARNPLRGVEPPPPPP
jgi:hypothetical protein